MVVRKTFYVYISSEVDEMDRVLSARGDEETLFGIDLLAKRLKTSKKRVIEEAVRQYRRQVEDGAVDVLAETCGAWRRDETPHETVRGIREQMDRSQTRFSAR